MAKRAGTGDGESLKRLGGGRWQTRDGRFTIEPQSGTWVVIDGERTDELGLPLIRGPLASLAAAKATITAARSSQPSTSPLGARAAALRDRDVGGRAPSGRRSVDLDTPAPRRRPDPPTEPAWIAALNPTDRGRARRLIERLRAAGARDPDGIARRDIVGGVPSVAAFALARAVRGLGPSADPSSVARLLADGSDEDLGVRWRLVDGDGRAITLDLDRDDRSG